MEGVVTTYAADGRPRVGVHSVRFRGCCAHWCKDRVQVLEPIHCLARSNRIFDNQFQVWCTGKIRTFVYRCLGMWDGIGDGISLTNETHGLCVSNEVFALALKDDWAPRAVYSISHRSYRPTLPLTVEVRKTK